MEQAGDVGDQAAAHRSGGCFLKGFNKSVNDRNLPCFVGEPECRLEPALVQQRSDELGLIPCTQAPDRMTDRPSDKRIGIAKRIVKGGCGRGVAQLRQMRRPIRAARPDRDR